jgi:predicted anti-sigma-YlaC factor YlaD
MECHRESAIVEISCMEVRMLNEDYLEGDLGLDRYIRVDAHLKVCRHCSAIYEGIRNVIALLGSDQLFEPPNGLDERFYEMLIESGGAEGK